MDNGEDYDTADGEDNGREELYCATYPTVGRLVDSTTITAAISCVCVMVARRCGRVVVVDGSIQVKGFTLASHCVPLAAAAKPPPCLWHGGFAAAEGAGGS